MSKNKQEFIANQEMRMAIEKTLHTLLAKNIDSEEGFKKLLPITRDENIGRVFSNLAIMHSNFILELGDYLRSKNMPIEDSGTVAGQVHRFWIDFKNAVNGDDDLTLLHSAKTGNEAALEEYGRILEEQVFPKKLSKILTRQMDQIHKSHKDLAILEKTEKEERARKQP